MSVRLAAVIPTRNRGTLALDAVHSLLAQDCDVDVFVSDNSDDADVLRDPCQALPRVHYLRPERPLSVADHWEWAMQHAMEQSEATHFMIHHDRRVALPNTWGVADAIAARVDDLVITTSVDAISDTPPPLRLWQAAWSGHLFEISTASAARRIAAARIAESVHALPLLNNSFVPRGVLQSVIDRFGDICRGIGPDTAFLARFLALHDRYLFLDRPTGVLRAPHRSSNLGSFRGSGEDFAEYRRLHGGRPWLDAAPIPGVDLGSNMLFHEYESVRRVTGERLPPIDRASYVRELGNSLPLIADREQQRRLAALLVKEGWTRSRALRPRLRRLAVVIAARLGLLRSFRDDDAALRHALRHPRPRQTSWAHLDAFSPRRIEV